MRADANRPLDFAAKSRLSNLLVVCEGTNYIFQNPSEVFEHIQAGAVNCDQCSSCQVKCACYEVCQMLNEAGANDVGRLLLGSKPRHLNSAEPQILSGKLKQRLPRRHAELNA